MCILKGFSSFVLSFDVQNGFFYESFSFDRYIEESNLVLLYFGREFDARVEFVSLCCISVVSILAMKILANDTAILDPKLRKASQWFRLG